MQIPYIKMYKLKSKGLKMQPICILKYFISPKWYQQIKFLIFYTLVTWSFYPDLK